MLCLHSTQLYRRASAFPVSCDFSVNRGTPSAGKGHFIRDKTCCSYVGRKALDHRLTVRSACGNRKRKVRILKTVGGKLFAVGLTRADSKLAHPRLSGLVAQKSRPQKSPAKLSNSRPISQPLRASWPRQITVASLECPVAPLVTRIFCPAGKPCSRMAMHP